MYVTVITAYNLFCEVIKGKKSLLNAVFLFLSSFHNMPFANRNKISSQICFYGIHDCPSGKIMDGLD